MNTKSLLETRSGPEKAGGLLRLAMVCIVGLVAGAMTYGCGDPEETGPDERARGQVTLTVSYANDSAQADTDNLHVWVLTPKEGDPIDCSLLVAGERDPYEGKIERLADVVFQNVAEALVFDSIVGAGVVYVEGVTVGGEAHIAGCGQIEVTKDGTTVAVTLTTAGVFDCANPATEEGAPCDDGLFCTVGESCQGGACTGGEPRDCSAGTCGGGTCSEEEGCLAGEPENGTPCDDGQACTVNDTCSSGECIGTVSCPEVEGECTIPVCSFSGECSAATAPSGTSCDNGSFCTLGTCSSFGTCSSGFDSRLCPTSTCAPTVDCDEFNDSCDVDLTAAAAVNGFTCEDNPCMDYTGGSGSCDGSGNCVGGTPKTLGSSCAIGCRAGSCDGVGTCTLTEDVVDGTSCGGGFGTCKGGVCAD